jgi:hypothetical protein
MPVPVQAHDARTDPDVPIEELTFRAMSLYRLGTRDEAAVVGQQARTGRDKPLERQITRHAM